MGYNDYTELLSWGIIQTQVIEEILANAGDMTHEDLQRLLAHFHADPEEAGKLMLAFMGRLEYYFISNNVIDPPLYVQETISRTAVWLCQGKPLNATIKSFMMKVAVNVKHEALRHQIKETRSLHELPRVWAQQKMSTAERHHHEARLNCLQECLQQFKPEEREALQEYYQDSEEDEPQNKERRQDMVRKYGKKSSGHLTTWVNRLKSKTGKCVKKCLKRKIN